MKISWIRMAWLAALLAVAGLAAAPATASASHDVTIGIDVTSGPIFSWGWWGNPYATGSFTVSGDLTESGAAAGVVGYGYTGATFGGTLTGSAGTLSIQLAGTGWTVTGGTGDYAGATGSGSASLTVTPLVTTYYGMTFLYGYRWEWTLTGSLDV